MVTCPSAINTTLLSLRTHNTVVPCIAPCDCAFPWLIGIPPLYREPRCDASLPALAAVLPAHSRFLTHKKIHLQREQVTTETNRFRTGERNSQSCTTVLAA